MVHLNSLIKKELITQINKGISINNMVKNLLLNKSTIYYYYKKLKGKKYKEANFILGASEIEGEIVGVFAGDGSQYFEPKSYSYEVNVHFGGKNEAYAIYVKNLFENYFNKKFWLIFDKRGTIRLRTKSKKIFYFFNNYLNYSPQIKHFTVKLHNLNFPKPFKIGFLRGLFDTDGSILYKRKEKRIRIYFCTTSYELIKQIKILLEEFNFKFTYFVSKRSNHKDLYNVQLLKESNDKFLNLIKPYKAKLLNGPGR